MKRARLRGLKRNAAVVLGNVSATEDVGLLERVRDEEPDNLVGNTPPERSCVAPRA